MGIEPNTVMDMQTSMPFELAEGRGESWTDPDWRSMSASTSGAGERAHLVAGSFRFPCDLVDARVSLIVSRRRQTGAPNRLSLWRTALREAIEGTAREAAHATDSARCVSLLWDRAGDEYLVSVTFASALADRARFQ